MGKKVIKLNQDRCISCYACELHCKAKNKVPRGAKLGQLVSIGPLDRDGKPHMAAMYLACFHCSKAWCVASCPTGAMTRREDGIVYVESELCVGCKACIQSCPWRIPQWNAETGRAIKCDYCRDRIDEGLDPACVTACCAHALEYVETNQASEDTRRAFAEKVLLRSAR